MRYNEFREKLLDALKEGGLFAGTVDNTTETIDLAENARHWKLCIARSGRPDMEPFHVSAKISFDWSPCDSARSHICEEDLLLELLGQKKRDLNTAQRFKRVDLELYAGLPYGSSAPIPDPQVLAAWTDSVNETLDKLLVEIKERQNQVIAVLGGREEVLIEARCEAGGMLSLKGLSVGGFRLVRVPRAWDDPDRREAEKGADNELARLAQRFKGAMDEWTRSIADLAKLVRYMPSSL